MIPVNQPLITKQDAISVYKSIKSGWVSSVGPQIKLFENKFKKIINKDRKSTRLNSSHVSESRMPSSA